MHIPTNTSELKDFLDTKAEFYENPEFIHSDPIQIPAKFNLKQDIEISGFLTATIAWGNRKSIINSGNKLLDIMGDSPYDFIQNYNEDLHYKFLEGFVHRTFNALDLNYFFKSLNNLYTKHDDLEAFFISKDPTRKKLMHELIPAFKTAFFELEHLQRTTKHVSNPDKKSAAKRINMFFRWMTRSNTKGVDFGIWKNITPSRLSCPLDVHSGNVGRRLGLITRKQNDSRTVMELDAALRSFDPIDPVKYDFALFGLGVFEGVS